MQNKNLHSKQKMRLWVKITLFAGIAILVVVFGSVLAILRTPDPFMNRFVKPKITKAFVKAYPAYSLRIANMNCDLFKNRFELDSVELKAVDGSFNGTMSSISIKEIKWIRLLLGREIAPNDFDSSAAAAHNIVLNFSESNYELRLKLFRISVPDSELVAESLEFHPLVDDETLFAESAYRRTRFNLRVPYARVGGLSCIDMTQGKNYHAHSVYIHNPFLDALVNKDKPDSIFTLSPPMPIEILSSINGDLQLGFLKVQNLGLKYGERFEVAATPAEITFDSLNVLGEGIANHGSPGDDIVFNVDGIFMKSGPMTLRMSFPVASPDFSFQYAGSLGEMNIRVLNSFLEIAEGIRIKGDLRSAEFEVNIISGNASGALRAIYKDLSIAFINKHTESKKGFVNVLTSFIANTFKIRGKNVPDKSGKIEVGKVKYTRTHDNPFFQFVWFALRTGAKDVAGF